MYSRWQRKCINVLIDIIAQNGMDEKDDRMYTFFLILIISVLWSHLLQRTN